MRRPGFLLSVFLLVLFVALSVFWHQRTEVGMWLIRHGQALSFVEMINRNNPDILFALGDHYFGGGQYHIEKAKALYEKTISLDERFPRAHYQLSRIHFIQGNMYPAVTEINKELEYYPDYKRSYYIRGLTYGYLHWYELAAPDFEEFLRWKPESWAGHNDLAWIYFQMGNFEKVLEVTESGLHHAPANVWLLNARGVALLNTGRKEEARDTLQKALHVANSMNPEDWGRAYPGNNPLIYAEGFEAMKASIERNLKLLD